MVEHTGERHFKCDMCGKAYLYDSGLRRHLITAHLFEFPKRTPNATKPIKLQGIGRVTQKKSQLDMHMVQHIDDAKNQKVKHPSSMAFKKNVQQQSGKIN